jgi:putative ABC transport system permease protein
MLMTEAIANSLAERRFSLILLGTFAVTALLLSVLGIYSVVSYFVSQRTKDIGVRIALGARPRDIFGNVLGEGAKLAAIGLIAGITGAAALARLLKTLLFGISPFDAVTFVFASVLLFLLTLLACYLPARRAIRIDPITALRSE